MGKEEEGAEVGTAEGWPEGIEVGIRDTVGTAVGAEDGIEDGILLGTLVGSCEIVGMEVGVLVGTAVGRLLGTLVGAMVGSKVSDRVKRENSTYPLYGCKFTKLLAVIRTVRVPLASISGAMLTSLIHMKNRPPSSMFGSHSCVKIREFALIAVIYSILSEKSVA